jgi:hypothetical protein
VEELCDIIKEILEEDGKGETITTTMADLNSEVGHKSYQSIVGPHGLRRRSQRRQMLIDFVNEMGLLSPAHGLNS